MSDLTIKSHEVSHTGEQLAAPAIDAQIGQQSDANATVQDRIPLTVRSRLRVLRVAPPIDDGFRPFRVF